MSQKKELRNYHELMEPEELTPEERLERIIELLASASVAAAEEAVLKTENGGQI